MIQMGHFMFTLPHLKISVLKMIFNDNVYDPKAHFFSSNSERQLTICVGPGWYRWSYSVPARPVGDFCPVGQWQFAGGLALLRVGTEGRR